ncbi:HAD-IIA family hydrolase [Nocardioides sp. HDW12B]|uniref:HAD-IIA family hydrolase n=1 Tax=Nocardioides sp. HDW12B TaxID=2714939 RepID=UPI00140DBAD9|nr:HAD-IIA family hydrolase [Nocardioides sp. HDW12B]QIK66558.1 HAD-IIA family hydrolase [Nocardioides sp. HDW12B]
MATRETSKDDAPPTSGTTSGDDGVGGSSRSRVLSGCDEPLSAAYDLALLDLDGVVYVGPDAVPGAPDHLAEAADAGMRLAYVTNNASRPPARVAEHLRELGVPAEDEDVVTSAQAAARLLGDRLDDGAAVFVIGGEGLVTALEEQGLRPVTSAEDDPVAVVSGFSADLPWRQVMDGAILVAGGLPWVASNTDRSVPTPKGPGPGNGILVLAVQEFAGVEPEVAGKPEPPLFEESVRRVGGERPLVVGDRLDTDIEGAVNAGLDSLLVLTGVTGLPELVAAGPGSRPTYLAPDLAGLNHEHHAVEAGEDGENGVSVGGWDATVSDGNLHVEGEGEASDWWRAAAAAAWRHLDETGEAVDVSDLEPPA